MTAEAILALVKKFWLPALIVVLIGALAIAASHYKGKAESETERANKAEHSLNLANATITDMQARQRDVAAWMLNTPENWQMLKPLSISLSVMLLLASVGCSSTQNVPRTERPAPAARRCFRPPTY